MRYLTIAGLQIDLGDRDNLNVIGREIAATKRRFPWVNMMVLGELSAYGFDTQRAEPAGGPAEQAFCRLAREHSIWLVPGSMFQKEAEKVYNAAVVIDPAGNVVTSYRKMFPFRPYEEGITPGDSFCVFSVPGVGCLGLTICYDIWFPELSRSLVWLGAEVLINVSVTFAIDREVELSIARATAAMHQCYMVNVNGAGVLGRGRSIVCGPGGEVLHQAGESAEVFVVELDLDYVSRVRKAGWNGLAQALKSFRDSTVSFPPYAAGNRSAVLDALGPIAMRQAEPVRDKAPKTRQR
jgi:predicted amidohydrolase